MRRIKRLITTIGDHSLEHYCKHGCLPQEKIEEIRTCLERPYSGGDQTDENAGMEMEGREEVSNSIVMG